jgi:hypothetical protein
LTEEEASAIEGASKPASFKQWRGLCKEDAAGGACKPGV